jgi:hypothetical protein
MRQALAEPFLHVSPDHLAASGMPPVRRDRDGPFAWRDQTRPRFFAGFHRCLPALAAAGDDLIVEHIIEFRAWREDLARLLEGPDVWRSLLVAALRAPHGSRQAGLITCVVSAGCGTESRAAGGAAVIRAAMTTLLFCIGWPRTGPQVLLSLSPASSYLSCADAR